MILEEPFLKNKDPNKKLSHALCIIKMKRKENAATPSVFFSFEGYMYIYNCDSSFIESTSSFDGAELMRDIHRDFQGLKECRIRPSVSSLKPYYFSRVCISLHNALRCGLHRYVACLI